MVGLFFVEGVVLNRPGGESCWLCLALDYLYLLVCSVFVCSSLATVSFRSYLTPRLIMWRIP